MNTCRITCRQILHLQYCTFHRKRSSCLHMLLYDLNTKDNEPIRYDPVVWYVEMLWLSLWTRYVDVDDLTRPNSAILLKQVSGIENFYITRKMLKDAKKKFSWNINIKDKTSTNQKHYIYIIYGCRLNNLETKSTHTQSPYPSKIIMISAMKNSNWIADFIYTSSAQVQVGQWSIERGNTHRKPPPPQNKNKTIKPFICIYYFSLKVLEGWTRVWCMLVEF